MTGYPTRQVAAALVNERLRIARERSRAAAPSPFMRREPASDAHAFLRALVVASLLFSRRNDAPVHRRSS